MPFWKRAAIADRKSITAYIAQDNPRAAIEMGDMLIKKAAQLDPRPSLGRSGRVKGTRELVAHPNYILIPALKKQFPGIPVIAAGGIATGEAILSMLA